MTSTKQAPAVPFDLPRDVSVGISDKHDQTVSTERIADVLSDASLSVARTAADRVDVLISVHDQADAAACSEVRELVKQHFDTAVILVLGQTGTAAVRRALQAGAHGVVAEVSLESALIPSIGAALAGQIVLPAQAKEAGQRRILTTREKQILGLVVMGMTNAEIAGKLFLAESTVKSHLSSAFAKLGVSSRSEAATVILDPETGTGLGILTIAGG